MTSSVARGGHIRKASKGKVITRTVLNRDTKHVMDEMAESQRPVVVVYHGRPEAIIQPISEERLASLITEHAAELVAERADALEALDLGQALTTDEVFAD